MALDEDATWSDLQQLRVLIDPLFETGGGRIVKSTGDGVLVEAPSVIEAVRSAIAVQNQTEEWNASRPLDRQIRLRIGVNLGDVIIADDGDVYGDGVNVAARLEALAEPGGICLSDSAYRQVRSRVDARFVDRGEQWVKNIPTPIRVWAVLRGMSSGGETDVGVGGLEQAEVVGRGGNATVYRAYQPSMDRWVAVKVLDGSDETTRRRFDRERQAMGRLSQHPGIVTIYESGYTSAGRPYLVMPYLGAGSLQDRLDRSGPMAWEEAADLVARVTSAVEYAHAAGVLHRDLKPGNIMMDEEGRPLVADFGIARLAGHSATITEYMALTPAFSPPELLDGGEPTKAGDIYALAATFCALVNGTPPFVTGSPDADTLLALSNRIAHDPPPDLRPLGVPEHVCEAVELAMAKNPEDRQSSVSALAEAIVGIASRPAGVSIPSTRTPDERPATPWKRIGVVAGAVGAIGIGAYAIGTLGGTEVPDSTPGSTAEVAVVETPPETTETVSESVASEERVQDLAQFSTPILGLASLGNVAYAALEDGTLHAVDAETGNSLWGEPFLAGGVASDLVAANGRIFFVRSGSKLIYAVDAVSGNQDWRVLTPFDSAQNRPFIDESNGNLAVGFGQGVAVLDSDGSEVWTDDTGVTVLVEGVSFDGQLLAVSDGRWVYGINAKTGERQWRTGPPDILDPEWIMAQEIEVDSGTGRGFERRVFVLTDGNLVLLDGDTGTVRWSVPVSGPPGSAPDETAFVSGVDGELVALNVVSGDELWSVPDSRLELPPFEFGESVFVLDGSEIVALNSRSGRERGRAQLPDGSVSRFGVIAGRVIVAVGDQLFAVSSPG